jgi:hypothetical protein
MLTNINYLFCQPASWKKIDFIGEDKLFPPYDIILDVKCFNDSICLILLTHSSNNVDCIVKRTTDGGNSWTIVIADTLGFIKWNSMNISNNECEIYGSPGIILRSSDLGNTWSRNSLPDDSIRIIKMRNLMYGMRYIRHKNNYIYKNQFTYDGGATWHDFIVPDDFLEYVNTGIDIFNENLFICRFMDSLYKNPFFVRVEKNLNKWSIFQCPPDLVLSYFLTDSLTCWAYAHNKTDNGNERQIIYKSDDGCRTWNIVRDSVDKYIKSLICADNKNVIACGDFFRLIRTTDGGASWIKDGLEGFPPDRQGKEDFDIKCLTFPSPYIAFAYTSILFHTELYKLSLEPNSVEESWSKPLNCGIQIYPNPAVRGEKLKICLASDISGIVKVDVFDIIGAKIFSADYENVENGRREIILTESVDFILGFYYLKFMTQSGGSSIKLIVVE